MKIIKKIVILILLVVNNNYVNGQCANQNNIHAFMYNGKPYEIVKENKTWIEAAACAVERGGILAEINDANEQNAITSEINNAGITFLPGSSDPQYMWIGGNDFLTEGNWIWDGENDSNGPQFWMGTTTGTPVGGLYNNWGNDPDNYLGQNALAMSLICWAPPCDAGLWTDMDQTNTIYYVIEYPPCNNTFSTISEIYCYSYTSPSGKIWTSSNMYLDTIPNTANCDSIITINLIINNANSSINQTGTLLTANQSGCSYQWLYCEDMTAISGATNKSYTAELNGEYAVIVSNNDCSDTSICHTVEGVGIIENDFEVELLLYPNPTNGYFFLDLGEHYNIVKVTILTMNGQVIQSNIFNERQLLNLKIEQPSGIYVIKVDTGEEITIIRFVKE